MAWLKELGPGVDGHGVGDPVERLAGLAAGLGDGGDGEDDLSRVLAVVLHLGHGDVEVNGAACP